MTQQEKIQIKLHCLSMAVETYKTNQEKDVINIANQLFDFVTGTEYVITTEDLKNNPSLKSEGIKKGDIVTIHQEI